MHKKRNWIRALRRSKSFRYFVISYVALLCAIMALNMVYYRKSSSMLFEQSVAMNNTQAERFASTLETEISNCMDSLLKIEKTYAFSQLLNDDSAGERARPVGYIRIARADENGAARQHGGYVFVF